jgi:(1->4)-alpha-D-glucan 1-alpha-D-glucosylmutase
MGIGMTEDRSAEHIFNVVRQSLPALRRIPSATYRLQFQKAFTFEDARLLVPYLDELGISDCYASPFLQVSSGTSHGYDISNHNALNPEIGSEKGYQDVVAELHRHRMGLILDLVPNHMGISGNDNAWWLDVLENGPSSLYAPFFDIDWIPVKAELQHKVLLPILGDQYGQVLENQDLVLSYQDGAFFILYFDRRLPIAPRQYAQILQHRLDILVDLLGKDNVHMLELQSIITALSHLPPPTETDHEKVVERQREKEIIKKRLFNLSTESAHVKRFIEENIGIFNGVKGDSRSFDLLDTLLSAQVYRLADWRVAAEEINYRRFFDINELAAIRMEDPVVFYRSHELVFRLIREGKVTGLRVDHPDGLYEPMDYLKRLQRGSFLEAGRKVFESHGPHQQDNWGLMRDRVGRLYDEELARDPQSPLRLAFYIVVEKILTRGEKLPEDWPVDGTTGYDFLNRLNGVFVDSSHAKAFDDLYARYIHKRMNFQDLTYETKKLIMHTSMPSEMNVLGHQLNRISEKSRLSRDFTLNSLTEALREIIACFPVYRTYVGETSETISESDRNAIERAVARAKKNNPTTNISIFDFIRDILCLSFPEYLKDEDKLERRDFVMKFQQCTGPIMAKGLEDTAFYVYNRLVSLNEVGGDPERFGIPVSSFHRENAQRLQRWPYSLLATSSHDTKRGEDVRVRINVLSEIPEEWKARLVCWSRLNKRKKSLVDDQPIPDRNEEYLLYQTLLGAWPLEPMDESGHKAFTERIQGYMEKALKEAKVNTSWINPNKAYDDAIREFISAILEPPHRNPFLEDFLVFQRKIACYGLYNSLSQTVLKIASPGVADIYQGNEIWDFSLVDPDNRRPVDYVGRRQMLGALKDGISNAEANLLGLACELVKNKEDGRIKLYVTFTALNHRRSNRSLYLEGAYIPLEGCGSRKNHICAFSRKHGDREVLVVVPRFLTGLLDSPEEPPFGDAVWLDTVLPIPGGLTGQEYRNIFTGETVVTHESEGNTVLTLGKIFSSFPVALLEVSS